MGSAGTVADLSDGDAREGVENCPLTIVNIRRCTCAIESATSSYIIHARHLLVGFPTVSLVQTGTEVTAVNGHPVLSAARYSISCPPVCCSLQRNIIITAYLKRATAPHAAFRVCPQLTSGARDPVYGFLELIGVRVCWSNKPTNLLAFSPAKVEENSQQMKW